jgi:Tfp pilus assembly protein PilF
VLDFEAAKAERKEAVIALEKHDIPKALDLATQATGHDPQTAEGWLILGAVHIYRGDFKGSREAFKTCVDVAKVGRRDECEALLH